MYKIILTSVYEKGCANCELYYTVANVRHPIRGYVKGQDIFAPNLGNVFPLNKGKNSLLLF